jgi:hypothetical protein
VNETMPLLERLQVMRIRARHQFDADTLDEVIRIIDALGVLFDSDQPAPPQLRGFSDNGIG